MDSGNTAWMLVSTALVLFMTPGLAFFYAGMVRSKNVLGTLATLVALRALGEEAAQPIEEVVAFATRNPVPLTVLTILLTGGWLVRRLRSAQQQP